MWLTESTYAPNKEARAHRLAAKRNPCKADPCKHKNCKAHKHILAAQILEGKPSAEPTEFDDRLAVQQTRQAERVRVDAFKAHSLGVK
jgi:hypothetical protein